MLRRGEKLLGRALLNDVTALHHGNARARELLTAIVRPALAVRYVVALGRRDLLWELLPEYIEKNVLEVWDD